MGAYLSARTTLGEFESLEDAAKSILSTLAVTEPDPRSTAEYQDHYERWLDVSDRLKSINL